MIAVLCVPTLHSASAQDFTVNGRNFSIDLRDKEWTHLVPSAHNVLLQGRANANGSSAIVWISYTGLSGARFSADFMERDLAKYHEGRRQYALTKGASVERLLPYRRAELSGGAETHATGVDFKIAGEKHFERTMYVVCDGAVFHVKSLDFSDPEKSGSAYRVGQGFRCAR